MQLSLERFNEIIARLHTSAGRSDKRRAERAALRFGVTITPCDEGSRHVAQSAQVLDFSPRGLCLEHSCEIAAGEQFVLHLPSKARGKAQLLCRVVYCRRAAKGVYLIGAEFDCLLGKPSEASAVSQLNDLARIRQSILL
jgi:hypothetical protein